MKTLPNVSKRLVAGSAFLSLLCVLMLTSCVKNSSIDNSAQPPVALLSVVQAVPDAPQTDFYLNQSHVNSNPINYNDHLDYFRSYAGTRVAAFNTFGTSNKLFSDTLTLAENMVYSLFVSNTTANPKFLLLTDTITKPSGVMAGVRFVDVSADAGAVDLTTQTGSVVVGNKTYNTASGFVPVDSTQPYTFQVRKAGTTTVLASSSYMKLNMGTLYTIYLHGSATATDATKKLGASVLLNAYY